MRQVRVRILTGWGQVRDRQEKSWRQFRDRLETGWWEMGPGWRHDGGRIVTGWRQVDVDRLYTDLGQAGDRLEKVETGSNRLETKCAACWRESGDRIQD